MKWRSTLPAGFCSCWSFCWTTKLSLAGVSTSIVFREKNMFVATKRSSRAYFCCYKRRVLSWQTHCRDKHVFSPQNFCRNKNDTCGSSRQWYKTARLYKLMYCQQAFAVAGPSSGLQNYISYVIQIIPADVHNQGKDSPEALWSKAIVIRFICTCPIVLLGLSGVRVL